MKKFIIILISDTKVECQAERINISDGEITLYKGSEVVAFFPRGTAIMIAPNE
jgi:hypothetical protein